MQLEDNGSNEDIKKYRFFFERILHLTPHPLQLYSQIEFYLLVDYYIQSKPITFLFLKHTKEPIFTIANKILQHDTCKQGNEPLLPPSARSLHSWLSSVPPPPPYSPSSIVSLLSHPSPSFLLSSAIFTDAVAGG